VIKVSAQLDSHKSRRISSNHVPTFQPRSNPVQVGDWKVSKQALQILIAYFFTFLGLCASVNDFDHFSSDLNHLELIKRYLNHQPHS